MNNMIKNRARSRVGKKKRDMKLIDDMTSRQVTFSKRRVGVFKKASELCILTGAEGVVLCESVGGRVFAFGHPTVDSVIDKYLGDKSSSELPEDSSAATETPVNSPCMHKELQKQYLEISKEMETEKNKSVNVMEGKNGNFVNDNNMVEGDLFWWQQPFEHLEVEELEEYISSMEELMNNLKLRANDLMLIRTSSMFDESKTLINSSDAVLSDEYLVNKNLNTKDYELQDEFSANKNLTMKDYGLQDDFFANKNLTMKDYGLPDEIFANKNLNYNDDGLLTELLAIKDPNFDVTLDDIFTDLELPVDYHVNNVQAPNFNGNTGSEVQLTHVNGNLVVPDNYGKAAELHNFDTDVLPNDFSYVCPPK